MSCKNNNIKVNYKNVIKEYIIQRDGWTPVFAVVPFADGSVMQLVDYVGGEGSKPTANVGWYLGASGYVENIGDATVFGVKGDPFIFDDFTPQQIELLQQPATEAAIIAYNAAGNANDAASMAIASTTNADEASNNANTAANTANQAATVANSAKGWSPVGVFEVDGVRVIKKLAGYIGGTGIEPTDNVGMYFGDEAFVTDKNDAIDYRGEKGDPAENITGSERQVAGFNSDGALEAKDFTPDMWSDFPDGAPESGQWLAAAQFDGNGEPEMGFAEVAVYGAEEYKIPWYIDGGRLEVAGATENTNAINLEQLNKRIPESPSAGNFTLKSIDGTPTWVEDV